MTIKEIAQLCKTDERTVRRWIDLASGKTPGSSGILPGLQAKLDEALKTKKPARFDLAEVLAIIRAGGKNTLADLLAENAAKVAALPAPGPRRYSAAMVHQYRMAYGTEATKLLLAELGFCPKPDPKLLEFTPPADPDWKVLVELMGERGARQITAVCHRIVKKHLTDKDSDSKQGKLL